MEDLKNIIESLIFVSEEPLALDRIKEVVELADRKEIREAVQELQAEYESRTGAFVLREVAGGYQFRSRPEYIQWIKKFIQPRPARLSKPALETLAIIAYKQPVIRSDIEHLRGVDCGGVLRMLMERKLIRVLGRKEIPGRPIIYATTKQFLELFELKNLKDLPTPKEIEELNKAPLDGDLDEESAEEPGEEPAKEPGEEPPPESSREALAEQLSETEITLEKKDEPDTPISTTAPRGDDAGEPDTEKDTPPA
ncbi:MAG: SMC-Scp complex subunit ScpB [Deltaproteobacteria bacterium]|nr:SMC-Scp complex subunit ScpB [Deltaproteobacteria bacterium]